MSSLMQLQGLRRNSYDATVDAVLQISSRRTLVGVVLVILRM